MPEKVVNMLCIRDPDYGNEYVSDAPINEITIDIGGQWNGYKYFAGDLIDGEENAVGYMESVLSEVADLPKNNPVRKAVEEFFANALKED